VISGSPPSTGAELSVIAGKERPAEGRTHNVRPRLISHSAGGERHVEWRSRCLREAGFDPARARELARDPQFDLHVLLELVDRGCPLELAVRIAAPLDWDERSP